MRRSEGGGKTKKKGPTKSLRNTKEGNGGKTGRVKWTAKNPSMGDYRTTGGGTRGEKRKKSGGGGGYRGTGERFTDKGMNGKATD